MSNGLSTASVAVIALLFIPLSSASAIAALPITNLNYQFSVNGHLNEAGSMAESSSPYWWVNSGGYLSLADGRGATAQGVVPIVNQWRKAYASSNPTDTDNGTHPQNLFRLVSRSTWTDVRAEAAYKINADNFSSSPNRNASNGLLLMTRYQSGGDTLYYAGIRVDGTAIIKKKKNGAYTTLATKKIFPGTYTVGGKDNFIPHSTWITLQSETVTNTDGSVSVRLAMKRAGETAFKTLLEARDTSSPILESGFIGIRTDFMDVEFDDVVVSRL